MSRRAQAVTLLLLALAALGLPFFPPVERLDLSLLDGQFRWLRAHLPRPVARDPVIIGIDDQTRELPEPITLWHEHFGKLFEALAVAQPAVVGVDIALPDRSYDAFLGRKFDRALASGLLALHRVAPVILGVTRDLGRVERRIYPLFVSVVGGRRALGQVVWAEDLDGGIRHFAPQIHAGQHRLDTLVTRMVAAIGVTPMPGIVDYSLGKRFGYVPMQRVLAWQAEGQLKKLRSTFAHKVVLLGGILPFEDRAWMPVDLSAWEQRADRRQPGVLLHAQALRSLLGSGLIQPAAPYWRLGLLALALGSWWASARPLPAALVVAGWVACSWVLSTWLLRGGVWLPLAGLWLAVALGALGRVAAEAAVKLRERLRLRQTLGGSVSPQVLRAILSGDLSMRLGGERRRLCVLFADIRDFTARSEAMPAEAVVGLLNRYFERMVAAIHANGGTIDKFIGDGIMAFFGAPHSQGQPCQQGLAAARAMFRRLDELNVELVREGQPPVRIGVGLHAGDAVVGYVGSSSRHEYSAIGDVVNVASRLEGLTKDTGYPLVVSASVFEVSAGDTGLVALGARPIKGHSPVSVYGWEPSSVKEELS